MITQTHLKRFVQLTRAAVYDQTGDSECGPGYLKEEYRKLGRKILKHIATEMGLNKGEFDIRWNPGGIACSGDHTLHTDKVYVALHDNLGSGWFYWRTVTGRKDYRGGANQIVQFQDFTAPGGLEKLIGALKVATQAKEFMDSHFVFVSVK